MGRRPRHSIFGFSDKTYVNNVLTKTVNSLQPVERAVALSMLKRGATNSQRAKSNIQGTSINNINRTMSPISSIPRDSEWFEGYTAITITHGASPNTVAMRQVLDLDAYIGAIPDENIVVFDRFEIVGTLTSGNGVYAQDWHFMTLKGPSTATYTANDANPGSGFFTQQDATVAGGTEVKRFSVFTTSPTRRSGSWLQDGAFQINLTDRVNAFIDESEKADSQGRSTGKFELWVQTNGTNASTSIINFKLVQAYHTRKRRVIT